MSSNSSVSVSTTAQDHVQHKNKYILREINPRVGREQFHKIIEQHATKFSHSEISAVRIDWETYEELHRSGRCVVIGAYTHDYSPVGYIVMLIDYHRHYENLLMGLCDSFFLDSSHQSGILAKRLISAAEKELRERGVNLVGMISRSVYPMGKFLEGLGYTEEEVTHIKILD